MPATVPAPSSKAGELSGFLDHGLRSLDIRPEERKLVVSRYRALGNEFDKRWADRRASSEVYPQGSFKLGTVTRQLSNSAELDVDLVALLDLSTGSISQADLKADVGEAVFAFAKSFDVGRPEVSESDRCWTLTWTDMHMDVLPALVDREEPGTGILITDRAVARWQSSDPRGYAAWFAEASYDSGIREGRAILAERTEVEQISPEERKTQLQRVVQLLKRHRDIFFADLDHRVSSIVITTLATRAYIDAGASRDLYSALVVVASAMPDYLEMTAGRWVVSNPVLPNENFADYWETEPELADAFHVWMKAVRDDLGIFEAATGLDQVTHAVEKALGSRVALAGVAAFAGQRDASPAVRSLTSTSPTLPAPRNRFAGGPREF